MRTITALSLVIGIALGAQGSAFAAGQNDVGSTNPAADSTSQAETVQPVAAGAEIERALSKEDEQRALAMSRRPEVVGLEMLEKEAAGLRALPAQAIQNWRMGRLIPDLQ